MKSPVAAMTLLLLLGSTLPGTVAGRDIFSQLGDKVGKVKGVGCVALVLSKAMATCSVKYVQAIAPLLPDKSSPTPSDVEKIRGTVKHCCALSALRTCVLNEIRKACGETEEDSLKFGFVSDIAEIGSSRLDSGAAPCTGKEVKYSSASPLCWPGSAKSAASVNVCGLVLLSCCIGVFFLRKAFQ